MRFPLAAAALLALSPLASADLLIEVNATYASDSGTRPAHMAPFADGEWYNLRLRALQVPSMPQPNRAEHALDSLYGGLHVLSGVNTSPIARPYYGAATTPVVVIDDDAGQTDRMSFTVLLNSTTGLPLAQESFTASLTVQAPTDMVNGPDLGAQVPLVHHVPAGQSQHYQLVLQDLMSPYSMTLDVVDLQVSSFIEGGSLEGTFCLGDAATASGQGCPCGNDSAPGANTGCRHSLGRGARLTAVGSTQHAANTFALRVTQAVPNSSAMLMQGTSSMSPVPFRDGLLCMGNPVRRLEHLALDSTGSATTSPLIGTYGLPGPGLYTCFQVWYRDTGGSQCGYAANFSNAYGVRFQ